MKLHVCTFRFLIQAYFPFVSFVNEILIDHQMFIEKKCKEYGVVSDMVGWFDSIDSQDPRESWRRHF